MKWRIGPTTYFSTKKEASKMVKTKDDVLAHEGGLGWYVHSRKEYARSLSKRIAGI